MTDNLPANFEVTGPKTYRPFNSKDSEAIVHADTKDETYNLGNTVKSYNAEKTICDLIKHKDKIQFEVYVKALNKYAKSNDKNINKLMEYARILKIENKVRSQMEVILNND